LFVLVAAPHAEIFQSELAFAIAKRTVAIKAQERKFIVCGRRFNAHNQILSPAIRAAEFCRRINSEASRRDNEELYPGISTSLRGAFAMNVQSRAMISRSSR
jgi:hypothetical protein